MAHLDVHSRRDGEPGWLLDVQADILSALATRVVVPLLPEDRLTAAGRLNPVFEVAGQRAVMATQFTAAVPVRTLGARIATLDDARDRVTGALDMLLTGV